VPHNADSTRRIVHVDVAMPLGLQVRQAVTTAGVSWMKYASPRSAAIVSGPANERAASSIASHAVATSSAVRAEPPKRATATTRRALAAMLKTPSGTAGQSLSPPR
jgi:hypothetical protein